MSDTFSGRCLCGAVRFEARSSPGTTRGVCSRCGSTLTCATVHFPTETHYHVGAFDRAAELQPRKHFFANQQLHRLQFKHT